MPGERFEAHPWELRKVTPDRGSRSLQGFGPGLAWGIVPPMTTAEPSQQSPALRERVLEVVRDFVSNLRKVEPERVQEMSHFRDDLGLDSLDLAALAVRLEEEFDLTIDDETVVTIGLVADVADLVIEMVQNGAAGATKERG